MVKAILKTIELDFASFDFYEDRVIARLKTEVMFRKPETLQVAEMCREFFKNRKFIYISDRKNLYNVDPMVYLDIRKTKLLCGIAVLCHESICLKMAFFEKEFARIPFEVFDELEDAIAWGDEILKNKKAGL